MDTCAHKIAVVYEATNEEGSEGQGLPIQSIVVRRLAGNGPAVVAMVAWGHCGTPPQVLPLTWSQ
jgi:hypothetical protein